MSKIILAVICAALAGCETPEERDDRITGYLMEAAEKIRAREEQEARQAMEEYNAMKQRHAQAEARERQNTLLRWALYAGIALIVLMPVVALYRRLNYDEKDSSDTED